MGALDDETAHTVRDKNVKMTTLTHHEHLLREVLVDIGCLHSKALRGVDANFVLRGLLGCLADCEITKNNTHKELCSLTKS